MVSGSVAFRMTAVRIVPLVNTARGNSVMPLPLVTEIPLT